MGTHTLVIKLPLMPTYHVNFYFEILIIDMDQVVSLYVARGGCTMYGHTRLDDPSLKPEHVGNS